MCIITNHYIDLIILAIKIVVRVHEYRVNSNVDTHKMNYFPFFNKFDFLVHSLNSFLQAYVLADSINPQWYKSLRSASVNQGILHKGGRISSGWS